MDPIRHTTGKVTGIISNLVTVEVDGPVSQNEICYISLGDARLMAEVIKVTGRRASVQVYESTRGLRCGDKAEFQGHMLEATLGPGLLSSNFDGLQNNLTRRRGPRRRLAGRGQGRLAAPQDHGAVLIQGHL